MKTYYGCGVSKDIPYIIEDSSQFLIQDLGDRYINRYVYPGNSINCEVDDQLVILYDTLKYLLFKDNNHLPNIPVMIQNAGQDSDSPLSVEDFKKIISDDNCKEIPNFYKYLYLSDCQFLVGTIQNLLSGIEDSFIKYYITLASFNQGNIPIERLGSNGIFYVISELSRSASSLLETYFTKAYSILDIVCKICYEIQNKQEKFDSYTKLRSANVLWGNRKKLLINGTQDTLFENCELISTIESLRNEYVHNGTWELNPKIFVQIRDDNIEECYMLFPDMDKGRLESMKSRKHFFSKGIKVNDKLPDLHREFKKRLLNTIKYLNSEIEE